MKAGGQGWTNLWRLAQSAPIPSTRRCPSIRLTSGNGYPEETNAPYGLAKNASGAERGVSSQQYGYNFIFLLPTNLYGPGDNFDPQNSYVIPALIRKCLEAQIRGDAEIVGWGDGSPTREFLYVEDAA